MNIAGFDNGEREREREREAGCSKQTISQKLGELAIYCPLGSKTAEM
jgi:hypothetical protein